MRAWQYRRVEKRDLIPSSMGAAEYTARIVDFEPHDWWRIEAASFRDDHGLRDHLVRAAPRAIALRLRSERREASPLVDRILGVPRLVAIIGSLTLPMVWGLPLLLGALARRDELDSLESFGVVAAVSAALGLWWLLTELRGERAGSKDRVAQIVRFVPTCLGVLGLLVVLWLAPPEDGSGVWGWAMVADLLVSGAVLALTYRSASRPALIEEQRAALMDRIERLPEARRAAMIADRTAAIDLLEQTGAIEAEDARRARGSRLGELGHTMAPVTDR